ncbi:alpha/beta fold hydrolase, partial [Cohnella hongkongensis]
MKLLKSAALLLLALVLFSSNLSTIYAIPSKVTASGGLFEHSDENNERIEYIISYKENLPYNEALEGRGDLQSSIAYTPSQSYITLFLTEEEKQLLLSDPLVEYVEPNATVSLLQEGVPTKNGDSYTYRNLSGETTSWGVPAIGGDIAHQAGIKGQGVKVAILDTGISPHTDLHISGGISVIDSVYSNFDDNGHGTHVAGIIGAKINNTGVVGIAPETELYSVKVLDQFGNGKYSNVIAGIDWAIENQMDIISMSFGGHQPSQILHQAIQRATDAGIIVVASAGNEGTGENTMLYPALFPEVLSVGAVNKNFERSVFSSTGEELDLVAPGNAILSTTQDGDYGLSSGTSVSAPFVAGAAALIWSQNRDWTAEEVKTNMYFNATDLGEPSHFGYGIVNVAKSLGLSSVPIPPVSLENTEDGYTWIPPVGNSEEGDVSISAYDKVGDQQTVRQGQSATVSLKLEETKSIVYIGVFNSADDKIGGTTYNNQQAGVPISYTWNTNEFTTPGTYRIKYAYSGTTTVNWFTVYVVSTPIPGSPPSAPSGIFYTSTSETIKVNWSPSSGATSYNLRMNGNVVNTQNYTYTYFNLQPNTYYPIEVAAVNNYGSSAYVVISPTPKTESLTVDAPTGLYVSALNYNSITINWNNMGSGLQYEIRLNGSVVGTTSNRTYTFSNLQANQLHTLSVATKHTSGSISSPTTIKKRTLFPVPTGLSSSNVTEDSLVLSWNAINGARFSIQKDGQYLDSTNVNSYTVTNLLPNRTYSFSVASKNGDGELSALSSTHTRKTLADNVKPTINNFSISGNAPYYTESYVDFSISSYDKYGIASQKFIVKRDNFGPLEYIVSPTATRYSFLAPTEGSYLFTLEVQDISGNTTTKTIGPINFVKKKDIVIYVPGFMNSQIKENGRVEWPTMRLPLSYNPLALNTNGTPKYNTSVGEVFERVYFDLWPLPSIDVDYGEKFLNKLRNRNVEVVKVAYDWRTDLRQAAVRLQQAVNNVSAQYPGQKVTIITHSMGGMVARYYLLTDQSSQQKVKTFINIVAPNLGTVRSLQGLIAGDDLDATSYGYFPFTINEAHTMVQNFPSVYQLLPSKKFVDAYDRVYSTDFKSYFKFNDWLRPKNNVDTYEGTKSYINTKHNSTLYEDPESPTSFRYVIENGALPSSIKEYRIVGTRGSTIIKLIREVPNTRVDAGNRSERFMAIWGKGDKVVPLISAEFDRVGNSTNYYVDQTHVGILSPYTDTNVSPMFEIVKSIVVDNSPISPSSYPRPYVSSVIGTALDIRCPVNVLITDQFGNTAFVNEHGFVENQIEGVAYEIVGESKLIFVEQGVNVSFAITGYDEGDMSIGITKYENIGPVTVNVLNNVSIKDTTEINFAVSGGQPDTALMDINYDYNGDGNIQVLHATSVLTPTEYLDGIAPISSHHLTGEEGSNNYYRTPVIVSLQLNDGNGGEKIYYSINNSTLMEYTAPFEISVNGINTLKYYSVDKAGNKEEDKEIEFAIDTEAPSQPSNLHVSDRSDSSITFSWSKATDNISNVRYEIYRNSILVDTINDISYTFNNLSLGMDVLFKVVAIDEAGNKSIASEEVKSSVLDLIPPITNHIVEGSITNGWYTTDITLTLDATDGLGSGINKTFYKIDNLPVVEYTTPLVLREEGTHIVEFYSVDISGNVEEEKKFEYKLDKTAPSSPTNLHVSDRTESSISFTWDQSTDNLSSIKYEVYIDGVFVENIIDNFYTISGLELGTNVSFKIVAIDEAFNRSYESEEINDTIKDTIAPTSTYVVEGNLNNEWYNSDVIVKLTSDDGIGVGVDKTFYSIESQNNNQPYSEYSSPILIDFEGVITIKFYSVDKVGNIEDENSIELKIDKKSPPAPDIVVKRDSVAWTKIDNLTWKHYGARITLIVGTDDGSGISKTQYRIGESGEWVDYYQSLTVTSTDYSNITIFTRSVDNSGNISNLNKVTVAPIEVYANGWYYIEIKGQQGKVRANTTAINYLHNTGITNVNYVNDSGNLSISYNYVNINNGQNFSNTIVVPKGFEDEITLKWDTEAPTAPTNLSVKSKTNTTVSLTWAASSDNIGVTEYDVFSGGVYVGSTVNTSYTATDLSLNSVYSFSVKARDAAGNLSVSSASVKVTTNADFEAPSAPANLEVLEKTDQTVSLAWDESTDNIGVSGYDISEGASWIGFSDTTSYTVTDLAPNTIYRFSVKARDADGNVSLASMEIEVVTNTDAQPPSAPTGLIVSERTETTVTLSWTASEDNVAVIGYDIYEGASLIGSSDTTSYTVTGLASNIIYTFTVIAKDAEGNKSEASNPVQSNYLDTTNVGALTASNHTVYVKPDGTVWAWGYNTSGQIGDGTTTNKTTAVQVTGIDSAVAAATGMLHTIALREDGTVWTWGNNLSGQLGTGNTTGRNVPGQVAGLTEVIAIAASGNSSYALKSDGTVWAWGSNNYGQLGDGTQQQRNNPVKLNGINGVVGIAAGPLSAYALKGDGTVWAWGNNSNGQLGDGTTTTRVSPVKVENLADVTAISAGYTHALALKSDGSVWAWGNTGVGGSFKTPTEMSNLSDVISISAGTYSSLVLKSDGTVWSWGANTNGQLGDGTTTTRTAPVQVLGLTDITYVAANVNGGSSLGYSVAVKQDGTIWSWGSNNYGQLGDGTVTQRLTPVQMIENHAPAVTLVYPLGTPTSPSVSYITKPSISWQMTDAELTVFSQYQVQVLDESDQVVVDSGIVTQAGTTSWTVDTDLPINQALQVRVKVKDETAWSEWTAVGWIRAESAVTSSPLTASNHTVYVKPDGTVWAWGYNTSGQIGDGTTTNKTTAVQVTGIDSAVAAATGMLHTIALREDGTVWTWGNNLSGQLGTGNTTG